MAGWLGGCVDVWMGDGWLMTEMTDIFIYCIRLGRAVMKSSTHQGCYSGAGLTAKTDVCWTGFSQA